ncbi:MAG: polymerase sigma factor SigW [Planctomycetota bacterium]
MARSVAIPAEEPDPIADAARALADLGERSSRIVQGVARSVARSVGSGSNECVAEGVAVRVTRGVTRHVTKHVTRGVERTTRAARRTGRLAISAILPAAPAVAAHAPAVNDARSHELPEPRAAGATPSGPVEGWSDEALVVAHRTGDASALRVLMERYRGELHGFLARLLGSQTAADDVFQEAFLQVHLSADAFDQERRFKPWLYTIAANKGRDFLRRQRRRAAASLDAPIGNDGNGTLVDLLPGSDGAPSAPLEVADDAAMVKQVVDEMPGHFREILLLAYFQKLSYAQISDSLGIPIGTVKSRLHAAVASFASSWRLTCARRGIEVGDGDGDGEGAGRQDPRPRAAQGREPGSEQGPQHGSADLR